jgi:mannosylfructose-6-phosphate phosphatase
MEGRSLLVSDLDGTLLGSDAGLTKFVQWYEPRRERLWLVYSSGRFADSIVESIATTALPTPRAIIGGVGTEIRLTAEQGLGSKTLDSWPQSWAPWNAESIRAAISIHKELTPQADEFQSSHKLSFFGYDLSPEFLELLQAQLASLGHRANLVYSSARDLDILPAKVDKGTAAVYLAGHWKIPAERVFVSGDSANDAAMFGHGFRGIVVGNGHSELQALTDPAVYKALGQYAYGVLEGLEYWQA